MEQGPSGLNSFKRGNRQSAQKRQTAYKCREAYGVRQIPALLDASQIGETSREPDPAFDCQRKAPEYGALQTLREVDCNRQSPMLHQLGRNIAILFVFGFAVFPGAGCKKEKPPPAPPPEVMVITVQPKDVPIYKEWIGALDGLVNAQIRAQVTGYLLSQKYAEGRLVKKGDL